MPTELTRPRSARTRQRGARGRITVKRVLLLIIAASPALAIPVLASGGGQNAGFNYTSSGACTYVQSYVSGSNPFVMSGTTQSYNGGCTYTLGTPRPGNRGQADAL